MHTHTHITFSHSTFFNLLILFTLSFHLSFSLCMHALDVCLCVTVTVAVTMTLTHYDCGCSYNCDYDKGGRDGLEKNPKNNK